MTVWTEQQKRERRHVTNWTKEQRLERKATAQRMRAEGATYVVIGRALGVSRERARQIVLNIYTRRL